MFILAGKDPVSRTCRHVKLLVNLNFQSCTDFIHHNVLYTIYGSDLQYEKFFLVRSFCVS